MEKKIDWVIHYVANGAVCEDCGKVETGFIPGFCNAHTHCMEKYQHPDFQMVLNAGPQEICRILNAFSRAVQNGARFHDGQYVTGIYEDCAVKLREYAECDRKVLRVIIPDRNNRFPDERGCELPYLMQLMETDAYNLFEGLPREEDPIDDIT